MVVLLDLSKGGFMHKFGHFLNLFSIKLKFIRPYLQEGSMKKQKTFLFAWVVGAQTVETLAKWLKNYLLMRTIPKKFVWPWLTAPS
jgi:hypothetical protein